MHWLTRIIHTYTLIYIHIHTHTHIYIYIYITESVPVDAQLFDGSGVEAHNNFPVLWAETCAKAIALNEETQNETLFFTRSGGAQTPKYR